MVSWNLLTKCTNCYRGLRGVILVATLNSVINFGALLRKIRILKFDLLILCSLLLLMKLLIKSNNMSNRVNTKASKSSIKCMMQQNRYSILVFLYGNRGATKIIRVLCKYLIQKYYILVTFLLSLSYHASFFPEKTLENLIWVYWSQFLEFFYGCSFIRTHLNEIFRWCNLYDSRTTASVWTGYIIFVLWPWDVSNVRVEVNAAYKVRASFK